MPVEQHGTTVLHELCRPNSSKFTALATLYTFRLMYAASFTDLEQLTMFFFAVIGYNGVARITYA